MRRCDASFAVTRGASLNLSKSEPQAEPSPEPSLNHQVLGSSAVTAADSLKKREAKRTAVQKQMAFTAEQAKVDSADEAANEALAKKRAERIDAEKAVIAKAEAKALQRAEVGVRVKVRVRVRVRVGVGVRVGVKVWGEV